MFLYLFPWFFLLLDFATIESSVAQTLNVLVDAETSVVPPRFYRVREGSP